MKVILSVVVFLILILSTHSAVYVERQPLILGHEGQCYDKHDNLFYKKGEEMKWREKICGRKFCSGFHGVEIQTCGKVSVPPECHFESNPSLPYPKCCGWIICPTPSRFSPDSENELDSSNFFTRK